VSASGLSSGADFVVQLTIAFSSIVRGVGVFAGQPYHCAVTYFPGDNLTADEGKAATEVNHCFGCPAGKTILYDHCKHPPPRGDLGAGIDVNKLVAYAQQQAARGTIDPLDNLRHGSRVWLYRGTNDRTYEGEAVNNTARVFQAFVPPQNIFFETRIGSVHSMPIAAKSCKGLPDQDDWCSECGEEGGFNACGYDGVGHALSWIYNGSLRTPAPHSAVANGTGKLIAFDQTQFFDTRGPPSGFSDQGQVYIPRRCEAKAVPCKLHLCVVSLARRTANP
jgi:poly(3-hydroxybutyrate) depolymerase